MSTNQFVPEMDEAVCEVLESMCFLSAEPAGAVDTVTEVARRLDFDGPFPGSFGIKTSSAAALMIACNLLGFDPAEITPDQVGDSMGELANMFCGAVLCRIEGKRAFALTKPVEDREAAAMGGANRIVRHFDVEGGGLQTWLEIPGVQTVGAA